MLNAFTRTEMLLGKEALDKLQNAKVAVFGIGGVGSFTAEALARTGVGSLVLIDSDNVCITNINRQIHATHNTVGQPKVEVMRDRLLTINPNLDITIHQSIYNAETADMLLQPDYGYVVDAIDTVTSKIDLAVRCPEMGLPLISSMGAANKLDPTKLQVADIYKTSVCPLAKVMRHELKKRRVKKLKVVYSTELPLKPLPLPVDPNAPAATFSKRQPPASVSFVPSVAGLILASQVVKHFIE
ncbi:MAG: tRNA cyclic N6-threonylcarbamoyladenosine(37) synthase TcdA [Epulopiscium sp. Nele67-Bin004]|nr:MAG: tRNA cyclic N6-threonylcarbamoyladenosine(37) synthase TcdA [Epulopiscium sp. Nele67-Bin004]